MNTINYERTQIILKVENVSVSYGNTPVLRDMNIEVKNITRPGLTQGQVVALLGPSGMGKTTLFRVLAGLMKPDSGRVLVEEAGIEVERGMVGVVAQNYPLFMHRKVLSNLVIAGRRAGLGAPEATNRSKEMLELFGMSEHGRKYPAQLSGGQRQRIAIAQQFMCSDHFLLMDEPFSGLDLLAKAKVVKLITDVAATDELKTIIIVTHDIMAAAEVADTILLLGRDKGTNGNIILGARIQASYDLIERGITWHEGISDSKEYSDLLREIRGMFPKL